MKVRVERQIGAQTLSIETGELAKQAAGSCVVQYGETVVLVAAATGPPRVGTDFFPLTCDYRERVAAAGRFPGGFLKREGRPTTKEILTARLMDRPIRPQFPEWFIDEVQIQSFVLASDRQNDGDILAMNGASAALGISPLPFQGPLGSVRLAYVNGEFIVFPSHDELEESDLDLIVSGSKDAILMIEGFARELPESLMTQAISKAHEYIRELCDLQIELAQKVNVVKAVYTAPEPNPFLDSIRSKYFEEIKKAKLTEGKQARAEAVSALKDRVKTELIPPTSQTTAESEDKALAEKFSAAWTALVSLAIRESILAGTRPDGRDSKTLRPISCSVDVLPRVHGSAVFQRGETQALTTVVLGTGKDEQRVDGLVDEYTQKFMLHYYFPSFSVGEVRPIRGPGRREIGHGALAERSVKPVLPPAEDFPYTIRIISDILESNGSSSMATVCASTLGLMAAGVPISNPVAGISIGLVKEGERWTLLTDIIGDEDHYGDMDFKVAGTQNGITGIQLDLKTNGISEEIVAATLVQAREARIEILRKMLTAISRPRTEISAYAPRLLRTHIDPEKIGLLIGPGGKMIRSIQEATGASIEVEDDGTVTVASSGMEGAEEALRRIEALTATVEVGRIYTGRVSSIKDFGAFVEILPGKDGLCHISELAEGYVSSVGEICKLGDEMPVKVILIDDQDRVKLSRKAALKELNIVDDKVLAGAGEPANVPPAIASGKAATAAATVAVIETADGAAMAADGTGTDKRGDPVIQALLLGKLSLKQENAEDILTSNVFGLLRYVCPQNGLWPFLACARTLTGEFPLRALVDGRSAETFTVHYHFWPRWPGCEPDVFLDIRSDELKYLVVIEAKYRSGKSSDAIGMEDSSDDADELEDQSESDWLPNDQLAKQWKIVVEKARERSAIPVLVYLTAHIGCPKDEIEESLKDCPEPAIGGVEPTICWLSWRELPRLFRGRADHHLADIAALADKMNLTFFEGLRYEIPSLRIGWTFQDDQWQFAVTSLTSGWSFVP